MALVLNLMPFAVRKGLRYAIMHWKGCATPNTCQVTIGSITSVIQSAGAGLDPDSVYVTFTPSSGSASSDTMTNQLASTTTWPTSGANPPGQTVSISDK